MSRLALQEGMTTKHPLVKFAAETGTSLTKIAKDAGCSRTTLYRIMDGEENTTVDMLRRISAATGGKVDVAELIRSQVSQ